MIQKISFTNYKAFDKGEVKLKPITILLGANSVGKSSILQLILMLQQTSISKNYKSSLRLHGENVSLGEIENIFKDKNTEKNIVLEFEFIDKKLVSLLKGELLEELTVSLLRPLSYLAHMNLNVKNEEISESNIFKFIDKRSRNIKKEIWDSKEGFLELINEIEKFKKQIKTGFRRENENNLFSDELRFITKDGSFITDLKETGIEKIYDFLKEVKNIRNNTFSISFEILNIKSNSEDVLKIINISLKQEDKIILNFELDINNAKNGYKKLNIQSDYCKDLVTSDKIRVEILKAISFDSTLFSCISSGMYRLRDMFIGHDDEYSIPSSIIIQIISQAMDNIRLSFSKELINYVSPLRAHPKRYYFLDKANINTALDTLDGDSLTEILKENNIVKNKVNKWLNNFNLSVNVSTLQDVIHKLKIKQNNLDLDITDVGFGISQVLPVIVQGFLSFENSLTIIEQPEIHLHPKMQADLADLFIDIVKVNRNAKKYLLIETHSEYLLKRLRRRISENKNITADDVAIYFVHPKSTENNSGLIEEKFISTEGAFDWPKDFYAGELLLDTIEFIKNQNY